jgi:gephyrin
MDGPFNAAILIVSTTAAKDPSADASATVLREVLMQESSSQWDVVDERIVSDNVFDIQRHIMLWTDGPNAVNLIVTTGGTGFSVADVTPEVSAYEIISSIMSYLSVLTGIFFFPFSFRLSLQ